MKVTKRYDQHRRDLYIDIKCEECGHEETKRRAYDDTNFWVNVVPSWKCDECDKSSNDLNIKPEDTHTRYSAVEIV